MGRSVSYLRDAMHIAYLHTDTDNDDTTDYYIAQENWRCFVEYICEVLQGVAPSLDTVEKRWEGNEDRIILENSHCEIGLSEYCGLVSVSIRINQNNRRTHEQLAGNWIDKVWPNMQKALDGAFITINKVGSFSNGEGVFEQRKTA